MKTIDISSIRINGGTQSRAAINRDVVADYSEAMEGGAAFPPVIVFYDGADYWLADGFHRYEAYARAHINDVSAEVRQGTQRDAILFSVGANAAHGLRRTKEDRERAVLTLLNDEEWVKWPQTKIAKACGVSQSLVSRVQAEHQPASYSLNKIKLVERGGVTFEQNTANIGAAHEQTAPKRNLADDTRAPAETEQPEAEPADPAEVKLRKEFRALSKSAQEDAYVGLSLDLQDTKAKAKKQAEEIRVLKAHVKGFEGDQADTIRRQAQIIAHKSSEVFRANEKADRALAQVHALKKQMKAMGDREIALD